MSSRSIHVVCPSCGVVSRRPRDFIHARRFFVCGGCKDLIPLDSRTILDEPGAGASERPVTTALHDDHAIRRRCANDMSRWKR